MAFSKLGWISRIRSLAARSGDSLQDVTATRQVHIRERLLGREAVQAAAIPVRHVAQGTLAPDGTVTVSCSGAGDGESLSSLPQLLPRALAHALAVRYLADNNSAVLGNDVSLQDAAAPATATLLVASAAEVRRHNGPHAGVGALRME